MCDIIYSHENRTISNLLHAHLKTSLNLIKSLRSLLCLIHRTCITLIRLTNLVTQIIISLVSSLPDKMASVCGVRVLSFPCLAILMHTLFPQPYHSRHSQFLYLKRTFKAAEELFLCLLSRCFLHIRSNYSGSSNTRITRSPIMLRGRIAPLESQNNSNSFWSAY
jgi:hypothetical protein